MFSISKISDAAAAHHYFSEKDDYYLRENMGGNAAVWYGSGAARAGLRGEVEPVAFLKVLHGQIAGQQVGDPGRHTPGWDGTFSAPKSVSVAALVMGDKRLIEAHDRAVRAGLDVLEKHSAMTRQRGYDGDYVFRETGELAAAVFRHASNRDQEPQLHSHSVIVNATYDKTSGRWVSIWTRDGIYKAQREANAVYINALAHEARALGYTVEWSVNDKGHPSFEFSEIASELREHFSGRTAAIDAELARQGLTRKTATQDQKEAATLATRKAKEHIPAAELHCRWRDQALHLGADLGRPAPVAPQLTSVDDAREQQAAAAAVASSIAQLSEREARFTRRELMVEARVYSQGRAVESALAEAIDRAHEGGELLDRQTEIRAPGGDHVHVAGFTTPEGERIESSMLVHAGAVAETGRQGLRIGETAGHSNSANAVDERIRATEAAAGYAFSDEHRRTVHGILEGPSGLAIVQGHAGAAKTTSVLAAIASHARNGGWKVRAMAPTSRAAQTLGDALAADSTTVAAVVHQQARSPAERELWIVDEAGMVSARDMDALLGRAEKAGARVILTGDEKQIGSVGAGRAFSQIQRDQPDAVFRLTDIKRQRSEELRAAVYDAIAGRAGSALDRINVREHSDRAKAVSDIADEYMQSRAAGKDTLVVTLSRQDRAYVNAAIQRRREVAGEVRDVHSVRTLSEKQWTEAERSDSSRYRMGDVIQANRKFKNLDRGETATVTEVRGGMVTVQHTGGDSWTFDPKRVRGYTVLDASETRVGAGDQIVAKGAVRAIDGRGDTTQLRNGAELTVTRVHDGRLDATDRAGEKYTIDAREGARFDLAYAQTANQAQSRTTDHAIGYMRSDQTNLADQQRLYVEISRARDSASIYTDDKAKLAETVSKNTGRKSTALDQNLDRQSRIESPRGSGVKDRALQNLANLDAETHRMAQQGARNLREWEAVRRADSMERLAGARAQEKQARYEEAIKQVNAREKDQVQRVRDRHGMLGSMTNFAAVKEKWAIERRAREDRERITLAFDGKGDSKRARELDSKRLSELKHELRETRKQARAMKKGVRARHGVLDFDRYAKLSKIDTGTEKIVDAITTQIDAVRKRVDARNERDRREKAQVKVRAGRDGAGRGRDR